MKDIRLAFKKDAFGSDLFARVAWKSDNASSKPIALIFHGGGLMVGSSAIIPSPQIEYLTDKNFVVVIPNYRLAPQVTGKEAVGDCEAAYEWAVQSLPGILHASHGIHIDSSRTVAMGHSAGGTLAMHLASSKPLKAVTAFYPSLFLADRSTSMHRPTTAAPFGNMPDFEPTDEDWASIKPSDYQVSEVPFPAPGTLPSARNKWQMSLLKNGHWLSAVQPDQDASSLDPLTRLSPHWAPVMLVQGEIDDVPGSSLALAQRAEREMKAAGVRDVRLRVVRGEGHMFDLPPMVGTTDMGERWKSVVEGLEWVCGRV